MFTWLVGVAIFVLLLGRLWRANPKAGVGALIGLAIAWILSRYLSPYVTGMEQVPIWLPPLPLAIVALTLFVFGAIVWLRADNLPPPKKRESDDEHGHH
jgi:hypothetical protein